MKIFKYTVFSSAFFCLIYRVTDEALIAETAVWPNFFLLNVFFALNGPVRLQRFSQRMPTYEKLMQNVGIRLRSKEKNQRKPFPERIQSVCITY